MDYSLNCLFKLNKKNNDLIVQKNKSDKEIERKEIYKVDEDGKIQYKKLISHKDFFTKNSDGIFFIKIYYPKIKEEAKKNSIKNKRYFFKVENKKLILQRSKYPMNLSGTTKIFPDSIFINNIDKLDSEQYLKILEFYIIQSPSIKDKKSITAKYYPIKKYWGDDAWKSGDNLKKRLIETFDNYKQSIQKFNSVSDSKESIKKLGLDDRLKFNDEIRIAFEDVCNNIFLSIFRHIRNGLAHGRFYIYTYNNIKMIFIEDKNGDNVTARMTIPVSILLEWIDIIKSKE